MKRFFLTISLLLLTSPVFAQDVDLIGAGGIGDLLDIPAPRGAAPPTRGGAPARGAAPTTPPVDRLVRLRELMNQANSPLNKEQETGLNNLINTEIPMMRQALQRKAMQVQMQKGVSAPAAPAAPPAQTAAPPPGAPAGARGPNPAAMLAGITPEDIAPEIIRLNDQLLGKIAAAPMLTPPQQAVIKKIYKDQIKAHGGFEAIKMTMDDANVSFTPEQVAQIQPLFDEQEKARILLIKENQGQPLDKAKQDQLTRETLAKVLKLLTPAQRTALLAPAKPPGRTKFSDSR
jgi:hypothetical protein